MFPSTSINVKVVAVCVCVCWEYLKHTDTLLTLLSLFRYGCGGPWALRHVPAPSIQNAPTTTSNFFFLLFLLDGERRWLLMLLLGGGRQSKDRYRYRLEQRKIVAKRIIVDQHNTNAPLISPLTKMPFPPYHIGFKKKKTWKKDQSFLLVCLSSWWGWQTWWRLASTEFVCEFEMRRIGMMSRVFRRHSTWKKQNHFVLEWTRDGNILTNCFASVFQMDFTCQKGQVPWWRVSIHQHLFLVRKLLASLPSILERIYFYTFLAVPMRILFCLTKRSILGGIQYKYHLAFWQVFVFSNIYESKKAFVFTAAKKWTFVDDLHCVCFVWRLGQVSPFGLDFGLFV